MHVIFWQDLPRRVTNCNPPDYSKLSRQLLFLHHDYVCENATCNAQSMNVNMQGEPCGASEHYGRIRRVLAVHAGFSRHDCRVADVATAQLSKSTAYFHDALA